VRTDESHAGSLRDVDTSWPLIQTTLNSVDCSFQQAQGMLIKHGYPVGPTDRLPEVVVLEVLAAEGYERERLRPV
jgi:hypothetical protein